MPVAFSELCSTLAALCMADGDSCTWRNVLLAGARGLEYTFKAIGDALSGEEPVEVSGFSHGAEPSQSGVTGRKKRGKKAKEEEGEKKAKRAPSAYNRFLAEQLALRRAANPEIPYTEHFMAVTKDWKNSDKNPKNAPGASKAPAATEDLHAEDFEDEEAEGLLEATSQRDNAQGTGGLGSPAKEAVEPERAEKEDKEDKEEKKGDKSDKKKRKAEDEARGVAQEAQKDKGEKKDKSEKKKRKKERAEGDAQEEVGGTGFHKDHEEGAAENRSSKKGKK